jgi:hypothetical protein
MNRLLKTLTIIGLLAVTAHRLPAPISEESPTPKPKAVAKKKADDEGKAKSQTQTKSKESPFAKFAGVWIGSTNGRGVFDVGLDTGPVSTTVTLRISNDGTIQSTTGTGATEQYKGTVSSDGHALIWQMQYSQSNATARGQGSLRLNGPKSGFYKCDVLMTMSGSGRALMNYSGTLTKQ